MAKLDREEKEIVESFERGEMQTIPDLEREIERYREIARTTFKKDRRVNIRISSKALMAIQKKALEEGIPYQTLISSVLHKYVSGRLAEKEK
jgi:predicted DNA binding CopG/RHH family protein